MNLEKLSRTSKIRLLGSLLIFMVLLSSCCKPCSEKERELIRAARSGNLESVRKYLENGGNPNLYCNDWNAGRFGSGCMHLSEGISHSKSEPLIQYYIIHYLNRISDKQKGYMLGDLVQANVSGKISDDIIIMLIQKDAHLSYYAERCYWIGHHANMEYNKVAKLGYDFNWIDPEDGNTLLMKYCRCPAPEDSDKLIETIQYLISLGARTDIKNKEGKTAKEIALNEKVKEFLEEVDAKK